MQAEARAPLSPDSMGDPAGSRLPAWSLFAVVAGAAFAADWAAKEWALRHLADGPREVLGEWFSLRLVFNPGAAFSTGTSMTWVFTTLAIVASVAVLVLSLRLRRSLLWALALGLVFAGITGNLFDRLTRDPGFFHGHVVDLFALPNFPVFNVADICINLAVGLILVQTFRRVRIDGSPDVDSSAEAGS